MSSTLEALRAEAEAQGTPEADTTTAPQTVQTTETPEGNSFPEVIDAPVAEQPETPAKSFASEKAARFDEFVRKTGKDDYKEFEFWQTPTADVNEDELLRKFFSEQEGMTEKEIAFEMNKLTLPEKDDDFDDDFGDSTDYSEKEILRERTLRKAKSWHEGEIGKLQTEGGEYSTNVQQRLTPEEYNQRVMEHNQALHQQNITKVYETLPTIQGLELKIAGNEKLGIAPLDVVYTPDEDSLKILRLASEDAGTVVNQFFNEGQLTDPKGWIQLMAKIALDEKMLQHAVEQAVIADRAAQDRRKRNVTPDNYQTVSGGSNNGEEDFDSWRNSKKY